MRYSSIFIAVGLAVSVKAQETSRIPGCLDDNCLRALKNPTRVGILDCVAFLTAVAEENPVSTETLKPTSTVVSIITPDAGVNAKRNFIPEGDDLGAYQYLYKREAVLPKYATTACTGSMAARFSSACSCIFRSSSRAGVTTVVITPVTATTTEWQTTTVSATVLPVAAKFKISYTNSDESILYLHKPVGAESFIPAEFTDKTALATDFIVNADGSISDFESGMVLVCDKAGGTDAEGYPQFLCGFSTPDTVDPEIEEPLKCARGEANSLRCGIPGKDFFAWIIIDPPAGRRHRRKRQDPNLSRVLGGIFTDLEELSAILGANSWLGGVASLFANGFISPPLGNTTTTATTESAVPTES